MFNILIIILRVVLNYVIIFATFRFMGKREVGELSLIDLVVFIIIAEIAAISIEKTEDPFIYYVIAIAMLVLLQKTLAYITLKHTKLRSKIEGTPSVIIANGCVDYFEMRKNRYTFDDLMNQLRDKDVRSISEVEFAILESSGTLSVFKKEDKFISPLPLVVSGELLKNNFKYVDIDEEDFRTLLNEKGYDDIKKIMYANYENNELFIISTFVD